MSWISAYRLPTRLEMIDLPPACPDCHGAPVVQIQVGRRFRLCETCAEALRFHLGGVLMDLQKEKEEENGGIQEG